MFDPYLTKERHSFTIRIGLTERLVQVDLLQQVDRVAVVSDRRPGREHIAYRGHQPQSGNGKDSEEEFCFAARHAETEDNEEGHPDAESHLHEDRGESRDGHVFRASGDDLLHQSVEPAQHRRKGIRDLQIGVAPEGFDYRTGFCVLGLVFTAAVSEQAFADHAVVEPDGRNKDQKDQAGNHRIVEDQRNEEHGEQHSFADKGHKGDQDSRDKGQTDRIDVSGKLR